MKRLLPRGPHFSGVGLSHVLWGQMGRGGAGALAHDLPVPAGRSSAAQPIMVDAPAPPAASGAAPCRPVVARPVAGGAVAQVPPRALFTRDPSCPSRLLIPPATAPPLHRRARSLFKNLPLRGPPPRSLWRPALPRIVGAKTPRSLFYLWLTGELMIHHRRGFDRVYYFLDEVAPLAGQRVATVEESEAFFARKLFRFRGMVTARGFAGSWAGFIERRVRSIFRRSNPLIFASRWLRKSPNEFRASRRTISVATSFRSCVCAPTALRSMATSCGR